MAQDADKPAENEAKVLIVDEYLNFTYNVEQVASADMFGLSPNLTDPESGKDEFIDAFMGTFDLNMSTIEDMTWDEGMSMRFCLQMYPALNSDGTENTKGKNSERSERYRMRFYNKNLEDFDFYPQVAHPFRVDESDAELKLNLDWNMRDVGPNSKLDHLDFFCSRDFTPTL